MDDLEILEIELSVAKEMVDIRDALVRLQKNKDFKKVIEEEYFLKEASRLVLARANLSLSADQKANILQMIDGIGCLSSYFDLIHRRGAEMEQTIKTNENVREDLLKEEIINE